MSEHDDPKDQEAKADELERELDEMQERSDDLGEEIEGAEEQWERRKADDRVPGAGGEPEQADGPEPEAEYPNKRPGDGDDEDDG
jgi:multidrug resistance efflux pump